VKQTNFEIVDTIYKEAINNPVVYEELLKELQPLCSSIVYKNARGLPYEDFVQELLLHVKHILSKFDPNKNKKFSNYLYRALVNKTHDLRKLYKKEIPIDEIYDEGKIVCKNETTVDFFSYCETQKEKDLIKLYYMLNGNISNMARHMKLNRKTVGRRINKILRRYCEYIGVSADNLPKY
jgi:RNA polymerase sigma factor (sigma-70 family)